jgi:hypothetical protein
MRDWLGVFDVPVPIFLFFPSPPPGGGEGRLALSEANVVRGLSLTRKKEKTS